MSMCNFIVKILCKNYKMKGREQKKDGVPSKKKQPKKKIIEKLKKKSST